MILAQKVKIKEERIEAVKTQPKPQSVQDIQVFLSFANFYKRFIKNFNKIGAPVTSMLQTTFKFLNIGFFSTKTKENQHNQQQEGVGGIGIIIKTLPKVEKPKNLARAKKAKMTKITNKIFKTDFPTFGAKTAFLHL